MAFVIVARTLPLAGRGSAELADAHQATSQWVAPVRLGVLDRSQTALSRSGAEGPQTPPERPWWRFWR